MWWFPFRYIINIFFGLLVIVGFFYEHAFSGKFKPTNTPTAFITGEEIHRPIRCKQSAKWNTHSTWLNEEKKKMFTTNSTNIDTNNPPILPAFVINPGNSHFGYSTRAFFYLIQFVNGWLIQIKFSSIKIFIIIIIPVNLLTHTHHCKVFLNNPF